MSERGWWGEIHTRSSPIGPAEHDDGGSLMSRKSQYLYSPRDLDRINPVHDDLARAPASTEPHQDSKGGGEREVQHTGLDLSTPY